MTAGPERPGRERPALQRVPPHDLNVEAALLGAALLDQRAAQTVARLDPQVWYQPAHATIAHTITTLVNQNAPCDGGSVGAQLKSDGYLDTVGGYQTINQLLTDTGPTGSAGHWADLLDRMGQQRTVLNYSAELIEAVYKRIPLAGLAAQLHHTAAHADQATGDHSWDPMNLARILAGEGPSIETALGYRTDGIALLYPGKVHALNAEPETGKSWLCLAWACEQLDANQHVIYVDFEADATDITSRLLHLGAQPAQIVDQFHYIRPDDPVGPAATARVTALADTLKPSLVVLDGVTEAMSSAGWSITDNDDIATFYTTLPRPLARTGAAVVLVDHVVKDRETQGRWGIGGQHKLAGVDGAVYKLELTTPFAVGKKGASRVVVNKDRHGQVRAHATQTAIQTAAHITFDGTDHTMNLTINPPNDNHSPSTFRPTRQMERISQALHDSPTRQLSKRAIRSAVRGDNNVIDLAIELLCDGHHARKVTGGIEHINPYQAPKESDQNDMEDHDDPAF